MQKLRKYNQRPAYPGTDDPAVEQVTLYKLTRQELEWIAEDEQEGRPWEWVREKLGALDWCAGVGRRFYRYSFKLTAKRQYLSVCEYIGMDI